MALAKQMHLSNRRARDETARGISLADRPDRARTRPFAVYSERH